MTLVETLEAMLEHLSNDTNYQIFKSYDGNGNLTINHIESFDLTNTIPDNHHAPYFKVDNLDQAKWLLKNVFANNPEIDNVFNQFLLQRPVDTTKELFISVFYPERI